MFKRFSKGDWMAYEGCTRFSPMSPDPQDADPLVDYEDFTVDGKKAIVVVDATGIMIVTDTTGDGFRYEAYSEADALTNALTLPRRLSGIDLIRRGFTHQ